MVNLWRSREHVVQTSVVTEDYCVRCAQTRPMKGLLSYNVHAVLTIFRWVGSERGYRLFCSICNYVDPRPTTAFGRDREDKLIPFHHRKGLLIGLVLAVLIGGAICGFVLWEEHQTTARLDGPRVGDVYELELKRGDIPAYTATIVVEVKGDAVAVRQAPYFYNQVDYRVLGADARSVANDASRPVAVISKDKLKALREQGVLLAVLREDQPVASPAP